jgi:hypothetical protein
MSLTKQTVTDLITVTENGIVMYREAACILDNGVEVSKTYHRSSCFPGQDLTSVPDRVAAICNTVWTPEVITAWQQSLTPSIPTGS